MNCSEIAVSTISSVNFLTDVIVPLLSALIGGLMALFGVYITLKYSLQGTTQSRYLTGGSARQIFHVMFKLSLVAAMVVIIKSTTRRLSSKDTFSQVSR